MRETKWEGKENELKKLFSVKFTFVGICLHTYRLLFGIQLGVTEANIALYTL